MRIASRIVAGATLLWAAACTIGIALRFDDTLAKFIIELLLFATFFAVANQRFGGIGLASAGALVVFAMQTPPLFQWGVGLGALTLGIAAIAVGTAAAVWGGEET